MMENDLIVFDVEYKYASDGIKKYCSALKSMINSYICNMNAIMENAIKDKEITFELKKIVSEMPSFCRVIEDISEQASVLCSKFDAEIDSADDFLY